MLDFLRDPIWTFIGAALAIVAIVVPILLWVFQQKRKMLSYERSVTPLLTVKEEIAGRLKVLFDDQPVQNIFLMVIKNSY